MDATRQQGLARRGCRLKAPAGWLDELAEVLDLAAEATAGEADFSDSVAAGHAQQIREMRAELRRPQGDPADASYGGGNGTRPCALHSTCLRSTRPTPRGRAAGGASAVRDPFRRRSTARGNRTRGRGGSACTLRIH